MALMDHKFQWIQKGLSSSSIIRDQRSEVIIKGNILLTVNPLMPGGNRKVTHT